jgi:hypothetical protein
MRAADYARDESDRMELARMAETGLGQAIERVLRQRAGEEIRGVRSAPRIDAEDIRQDVRYRFGFADGVEWLLKLRDMAAREVRNQPQQERTGEG